MIEFLRTPLAQFIVGCLIWVIVGIILYTTGGKNVQW